MTVIVIATLYPFWYILVSSFSSISHIIGSQIILWPDGIHLDAYRQIFRNNLIPNAYKITLIVTIGGTTLSMIMTILAAYVLSRKTLPGQKWLTMFAVFTMLFNGGLVPTYLLVNSLKMTNTLWALIFPGALSTYNMVIMRNFFSGIPESLYEAAPLNANFDTKLAFIFFFFFACFYTGILQIRPHYSLYCSRFCNNRSHKRQICFFSPLASPHESSDFCFSRPQKPPFPPKNAPYSGRLVTCQRIKSSRV